MLMHMIRMNLINFFGLHKVVLRTLYTIDVWSAPATVGFDLSALQLTEVNKSSLDGSVETVPSRGGLVLG